jgi:tRNA pseudouridine38-40 synthase
VRTVESELENALYKVGAIAEYNYGDLKKIGFSRATRTDKRVHAL